MCADGAAGTNFEHTSVNVDGHTVLRFAADVFTEGLMLLAHSINPSAPTLFHAPLSPHGKSYRPPKSIPNGNNGMSLIPSQSFSYDTSPAKLLWTLTPSIPVGIRYAETQLSDLKGYLLEVQRILIQLHRSTNERPAPFFDHAGILRDSKTGRPISNSHGYGSDESGSDYENTMPGHSFFDSGDIDLLGRRK